MIYVLYSMALLFNQNLEKQLRSLTITSKVEALSLRLSLLLTLFFFFLKYGATFSLFEPHRSN